jgi:hypothetical protein
MLVKNPNAIELLEANVDKFYWYWLSRNPNAIPFLEKNPDKICWWRLSANPNAIHLLEANQDKIHWDMLSTNPNAIHLFEQNQEKIVRIAGGCLLKHPSIFVIDYKTMKKQMVDIYFEELIMVALHPKRISAWLDAGVEDF